MTSPPCSSHPRPVPRVAWLSAPPVFLDPVQSSHSCFHFALDFCANLCAYSIDAKQRLTDVPLPGRWLLGIKRQSAGGEVQFQLRHDGAETGSFGNKVTMRFELHWRSESVNVLLASGTWYDEQSAPEEDTHTGKAFQSVDFVVTQAQLIEAQEKADAEAAGYATDSVCLFFPRPDAEIWTTRAALARSTAYYDDLLSSDFAEAARRSLPRTSGKDELLVKSAATDAGTDDSDDELDDALDTRTRGVKPRSGDFYEITLSETAFSTFVAFLAYEETGAVHFAPLRSSCAPRNPTATATRLDLLATSLHPSPSSAPLHPVSPKSLYRLCHYLDLSSTHPLPALCLASFAAQLTPAGAALELFSDPCICYDALRGVVVEYVARYWARVSATETWAEGVRRAKEDEPAGTREVWEEVMRAVEGTGKGSLKGKGKTRWLRGSKKRGE
ncbi:hypothetical protein JCM8097_006905 [Rhodosporidiobolus ruineniae]